MAEKKRLATLWLDGCSGCHMSLLDIDERLIALAEIADIVYSPLVDAKEFPEDVDVTLLEGAISSDHDLALVKKVRARTKLLASLGDCAVTANVSGMRNHFAVDDLLRRAYVENADTDFAPSSVVPTLLPCSRPVHAYVPVDLWIPGCPPSADTIYFAVTELLAGRIPDLSDVTRFGA
jgi:NAD-reducing hydrogenase small subunit